MVTTGLVFLALVALACGESGSVEEADQAFVESLNKMKNIQKVVPEEVSLWSENYSDVFGLPDEEEEEEEEEEAEDETATSEPHVVKEHVGHSTVWKVLLVLAVLLFAVLGILSTVYYLCVWRGGRIHYEQQKDIST